MASKKYNTRLPAPFLKRVSLIPERVTDPLAYPFCIPLFAKGFELTFRKSLTIIVGENGTGKSTLLEGIAALAGYDDAGGGKGYRPVDHSQSVERSGGLLAEALKGAWLPKVTSGWFFKAESFFSVAHYLDAVGSPNADFLSHSHGEGFMRFFEERCERQGIYILDEPESALSPLRQIEFLKLLVRMQKSTACQVIIATHSPIIMACPGADLLQVSKYGIYSIELEDVEHFRIWREFTRDPSGFLQAMLE